MESTFLSRIFSDQGIKMRIRKEHRLQQTSDDNQKRYKMDIKRKFIFKMAKIFYLGLK